MFPFMTVEEFIVFWFGIYFETNKFKMFDDFKNLIFVSKFIKQKIYSFYSFKLERDYRRFSLEFFQRFCISPFAFYDSAINSNLPKIIVNQISHEIPENESTFVHFIPEITKKIYVQYYKRHKELFSFGGNGVSCYEDLGSITEDFPYFYGSRFMITDKCVISSKNYKEYRFHDEFSFCSALRNFKVFPISKYFLSNAFFSFEMETKKRNEFFSEFHNLIHNLQGDRKIPDWVNEEIIYRFSTIFEQKENIFKSLKTTFYVFVLKFL